VARRKAIHKFSFRGAYAFNLLKNGKFMERWRVGLRKNYQVNKINNMELKKEELIKKLGELENELKDYKAQDEQVRHNLSGFLGFTEHNRWTNVPEIKLLKWSEIYFNLGKLKEQKRGLENNEDFRLKVEHLMAREEITSRSLEELKQILSGLKNIVTGFNQRV